MGEGDKAPSSLSLLFEIQDLDNGECCLSCRVGRGRLTGWLRFIRYSGSGLQMGNKSEAMSVLICSVTVCVTLSSIVQSGQKSSADLHVSRANKKEGGREARLPPLH